MKYLLMIIMLLFSISYLPVIAQDFDGKQEDPDMEALKKWIMNKRLITVKEIGGDLSVSGEVRTEMQAAKETKDGVDQRGKGAATTRPTVAYDVEVNLMLDYRTERTWAAIKLEFDNDMGIVNGTTSRIALERAYLGGRIYPGETFVLDAEVGRKSLGNIFDSKIEFSSIFDGALLKINKSFESIGNFYLNGGVFLVDDRQNHYGEVAELGMLRVGNTGVYLKYSVINWAKEHANDLKSLSFNYLNSQIILGYQGEIPKWKKFLKVYSGFLVNHLAKRISLTHYKKVNKGGYVGFSVGQIRKSNDWALDTSFQVVAAQAIPDFDSGGIKRGNAAGIGFYTQGRYGEGDESTVENAVGGCNYKGWEFEFLYAITSNLTLLNNFQISRTLNKNIGPNLKYIQYEIELIYAF